MFTLYLPLNYTTITILAHDNKIYWSKKAFLDFAEKYKSQYEDIKTALKKLNKPYFVVEYESFCKQPNQIQYLANKLKELGITDLDIRSANTVKQSKDRQEYESCFKEYHVKNFIKDLIMIGANIHQEY